MKAYKGFYKDKEGRIYCQPSFSPENRFYYKEGETYELPEGKEPKLCYRGFHACTLPMDVFYYYNSSKGNMEYHEVELDDVSDERSGDSKVVGNKITIGSRITPDEMVEISIKMMVSNKEKYFNGEEYAIIRKDAKYNYIGTDGKILSETWFDWCNQFKNGIGCVRNYNESGRLKWNYIDTEGKLLCEEWFDWVSLFYEGFAVVQLEDSWNFIDTEGKLLCEEWFDWVTAFREGFGIVGRSGKYNFIDKDGKILSDTWFVNVKQFSEGFAKVAMNGEWKTIDKNGKIR